MCTDFYINDTQCSTIGELKSAGVVPVFSGSGEYEDGCCLCVVNVDKTFSAVSYVVDEIGDVIVSNLDTPNP